MFKKILIANRGEIACRIIRTAKRMGIKTVAVYSAVDKDALHVDMADEAVHIGPPAAAESYLVIEKIINACKETGAEAVHPGYGFLSEREAFAVELAKHGIVFIGPNPKAIAAMGDKIESKKAAAAANVSTVPGYLGVIEDEQHAVRIAEEIGFPVMIKASAGGGGKGMRVAHSKAEVLDGFKLARAEAKASFGDDRVFIEKFIIEPRHIEIQVLGDKHGHVIHLGERECSIQRRNQKVIEEAPSPLLDPETRAKMGAQAVALAKAVGYDSAGTVEFVAGQDRSFYFLEMNTRLQVEHPVTEMVTGIDLVEQMIRVAAGEPLKFAQDDIKLNGWAIESRIYAEDPFRSFLPSTGRLTRYRPPHEGPFEDSVIRNDTGVFEGGEISIWYDPMIAKLVTHAPTRNQAIDAMAHALDAFAIEGIQHNIPFLSALMQHPRWRSAKLSTGFIAEEYKDGFKVQHPEDEAARIIAAVAASIDFISTRRRRLISGQIVGRPIPVDPFRCVVFEKDLEFHVKVSEVGGSGTEAEEWNVSLLTLRGREQHTYRLASFWKPGDLVWRGTIDGVPRTAQVRTVPNGFKVSYRGVSAVTFVYNEREAKLAALMPQKKGPDHGKELVCPMPGLVVEIAVKVGQEVKTGEALCIVEAMKMQNVLRAERDVTIKTIKAAPGDSMAVDAVIMEFA